MADFLSVVICTYRRYDALQQTVQTLLASRGFRETPCEVVIVENTPESRREPIAIPDLPNVRVVVCEDVGLSNARNFGIRATRGEVVAFLDDDALVCDDWCKVLLAAFADPEISVVGGKVVPLFPTEQLPAWYDNKLSGYLSCIDWGPRTRHLAAGEWIVGANMAFRRSVFDTYGLFGTELGRKGSASLLSNEEIALLEKVGMTRVLYVPDASVQHMIPMDRVTPKWFRRRVYWQAVSDMVAGIANKDGAEARREFGKLVAGFEAERRNLNGLFFEPENYEQFAQQLSAIYLASIVFGDGGI